MIELLLKRSIHIDFQKKVEDFSAIEQPQQIQPANALYPTSQPVG
jgi:hypothetical protein